MTIVETATGKVQGLVKDGVQVFKGIPYAAPPVDDLRFRPPQPAPRWDGVRECTSFGPIALQNPSPLETMFGAAPPAMDEDCLSLNVWTPATDDGKRPVMVWIHGGAFITGSGGTPWYDGRSFARDGVVLVTINYRLGAFGFLHVDGQGNNGMLDQVAALEWVRDNIAAFGGDPDDVTAFGESAGAMSVGTLLGLPAAKGLFVKAIAQSGAGHNAKTAAQAEKIAEEVLGELDVEPGDGALDRLRQVPVTKLLEAQATVVVRHFSGGLPFTPVVDGVVLPERPIDAIGGGSAAGVRVLIGTTREEWKLFSMLDPTVGQLDEAALVKRVGAPGAVESYRARRPDAGIAELWSALQTDQVFRIPAVRLAERQSALGNDVYMYRFDYGTPAWGGALGACHALEIPFVFESLEAPGANMFVGPVTDELRTLSRRMHESWTSFARSGRPAADGLPEWPRYTTEQRATMLFDVQPSVAEDPDGEDREVWADLV
jgi:para-nitrobenzyl esterase